MRIVKSVLVFGTMVTFQIPLLSATNNNYWPKWESRKKLTTDEKELKIKESESNVDISSRGVAQKKLLSAKVELSGTQIKGASSLSAFMRNNGPIPFFPISDMGNIGSFWYEEIEELSRIARLNDELPALEGTINTAIKTINGLGRSSNPLESINSVKSKTRLHAAMIQRLLLAFQIVRSRTRELKAFSKKKKGANSSGNESLPALYNLFKTIVGSVPGMVNEAVGDVTLFEWALRVKEFYKVNQKGKFYGMTEKEIALPVIGFGHSIMTLVAIGKDIRSQNNFDSLNGGLVNSNFKANSEAALDFVKMFEACSIEKIKEKYDVIVGWLNNPSAWGTSNLVSVC
jgi:hypothetical protein